MAKLYFKVASDWEEVVRLRNEIAKLKQELKNMDSTQTPAAFVTLNTQLAASTQRMDELVTEAAKAGTVVEGGFKRKIFDASQTVNGFTEKIIAQKAVVKDIEADVRRLGDAYRTALKRNPLSAAGKLGEYNAARKALDKEKAALFGLTQEQANARLSVKKLRDEYALFKEDSQENKESIGDLADEMKGWIAGIAGGIGIKEFIGQMIKVRGEFQAADTAIQTLLGSKEKADALMKQVREYAKISPLEFSDVTAATQMMLGFNIEAEKVPRFLAAIGDVSMGESQKFNSLTLAFSQMSATGKLTGQDMNQMINAGFNPLQAIADKTGKSITVLKEEMSKSAISAEMVQQAFLDATGAGGKFYQMSENASKTINGQLSMMQDAMDAAFNEMGEKSEGVIISSIQVATSLIENYETIGKVLAGLIVTYGVYKAALITNITLTRSWAVAARADAVAKGLQTIATKAQTVAQLALNSAMKANPYVLAATLIMGAASAMWAFHDSATEAEKAQRRFNERQKEAAKQEQEHKQKIDSLVDSTRDIALADIQRGESLAELRREYPKIFAKYDIETIKLADILKLKRQIADEDARRAGEKKQKELTDVESEIKYYENLLKSLSGQQGVDGYVKKLKELRADRDVLLQEKGKGISEQFIASLKGADMSSFDRYITELEKRIKGKGESGKVKLRLPIDAKGSLSDEAIYDVKDIKTLIDTAKTAKKTAEEAAKAEKKTGKEWLDYYKGKYEEADKAYNDFLKSKTAMSDADRDKELKRLKGLRDTAKKTYESKGGVVSSSSKQESEAEKQKKAQEKYKLLLDKQSREQARMKIDSLHELEQIEINGLQEGSEKVLRQRKLNHEKELEQIKREAEDKKLKEIEKAQTAFEANPENKGKSFDVDKFVKSEPAKKQFAVFDKVAETKTKNADTKYNRGDDLKGLLNEYQDYTDKRLEIEKKFNEDIAVLQEQRKQAVKSGDTPQVEQIDRFIAQATKDKGMGLMSLDYDKMKESPEYVRAFENLKETSSETLNSLLSQLENAKQTAAKVLSPDQLREYTTTIQEIMDELDSRNPFQALSDKKQELAEAEKELAEAQRNLDKIKAGENVITGTRYNNKTGKIETAYLSATQALDNYNKAKDKTVKADSKVQTAEKKVSDVIDGLAKSINDIGTSIGGQAGEILGLISDISTFAMSAMSGVEAASQTASAAVKAVESASVILMIISMAIQIATKIANIFSSNKDEERKKYIDQLNAMIDIYERIIEKQKESIKFGYGFSAITSAKNAMEELNKKTEQYRKIAQSAGASKDSLSRDYMDRFVEMLNEVKPDSFNMDLTSLTSFNTGDLSKFTAKQLLFVRDNYKDIWTALNEEQRNVLQAIIDAEEESKEIVDAWKESITGISYDNLYSEFIDTLSDMDSSAEDMANNFGDYLRKSILAAMVADEFKNDIDNLYEMWIKAGDDKSEGGIDITKKEAQLIQERQKEIVESMIKRRDEMEKTYGWDTSSSSQESTKKGFQAMSQETGEELNGRFTALQIAGEEIKNQSIIQTGLLSSINEKMSLLDLSNEDIPQLTDSTPNIAGRTREIITNSYQPQVNVIFPDAKLDVLTVEVSTMKNIVNEMRTLQVEGNLDTQEIREGIQIISKNSPRVLANMDEMKRDIKNVL